MSGSVKDLGEELRTVEERYYIWSMVSLLLTGVICGALLGFWLWG
tara:strand:+ start:566 stop:700 length:135 start_codon:yes stop_codon:yes gene_type:complete